MCIQTYFPVHRGSFDARLGINQRYRNDSGDARLSFNYRELLTLLATARTCCCSQLTDSRNKRTSISRFLTNDYVKLSELIHVTTRIPEAAIAGKDLLVDLDGCTFSLSLDGLGRSEWIPHTGVTTANKPGLQAMPSFVLDRRSQDCIGVGDILIFGRPPSV